MEENTRKSEGRREKERGVEDDEEQWAEIGMEKGGGCRVMGREGVVTVVVAGGEGSGWARKGLE